MQPARLGEMLRRLVLLPQPAQVQREAEQHIRLRHPGGDHRQPGPGRLGRQGVLAGAHPVAHRVEIGDPGGQSCLVMLRRQRMEGLKNGSRADLAEAEARKWQERANTFMHELACFRETIDYEDPETGVGSTRQFEVEFIKQVARFRRGGQPFTVALLGADGSYQSGASGITAVDGSWELLTTISAGWSLNVWCANAAGDIVRLKLLLL